MRRFPGVEEGTVVLVRHADPERLTADRDAARWSTAAMEFMAAVTRHREVGGRRSAVGGRRVDPATDAAALAVGVMAVGLRLRALYGW
ncbi:hypothetical protein ACFUIV_15950 [Streptomyces anulatus]|uniref:hypothetical protein n=1 Tax=Streptomyces anulatus TaxID=1892 RepID=UPI00363AABA2